MMGRLGVLKPLRGTESSLANIVLDEGEIAFSYPSTGPGTGLGGIKMGDGSTTFSNLPWYITGEGSDPGWSYDTGTDEAALLHNIERPEMETIGKIYYIQSYFKGTITQNIPYMVIGINHENSYRTIDLMSKGVVKQQGQWRNPHSTWSDGKYTISNFYSWIANTCPNGYSSNIQAKMCYMTERWREATGNTTGELQTRQTKCKMLNPYELFGSSVSSWKVSWASGYVTDFTTYNYGEHYSEIFSNSTSADSNRIIFSNLTNHTADDHCATNSYYILNSYPFPAPYEITTKGAINGGGNSVSDNTWYITAVIRLSDTPF